MNPTTALLAFSNLLETSRLIALGKTYEKQEELVALCRADRRAFLASMPVRSRFRCEICGVETTEIELHFEDPNQKLTKTAEAYMWGTPAGRYFKIEFSSLHKILYHSQEMPEDLKSLLENVKP